MVFFIFARETTENKADIAAPVQLELPKQIASGVLAIHENNIEELPSTFESLSSDKVKIIFNFSNCSHDISLCRTKDGRIDFSRLHQVENMIFDIAEKQIKKWEEWARKNLYYWPALSKKILPIRIILNPSGDLDSSGVLIGNTGVPMTKVFSIDEKFPEIEVGTKGVLDNPEFTEDMISHELGHVLHNKLGIQSHTGRLTETFGDVVFSLLSDGKTNFGGPQAATKLRKSAGSSSGFPGRQELLKMMSSKGVRDFASSTSNFTYQEALKSQNPYAISSLINRSLYLVRDQVDTSVASQAFFELAYEKPHLFADPDPSVLMSELKKKFKKKLPTINWPKLEEELKKQGWVEPKIVTDQNARLSISLDQATYVVSIN